VGRIKESAVLRNEPLQNIDSTVYVRAISLFHSSLAGIANVGTDRRSLRQRPSRGRLSVKQVHVGRDDRASYLMRVTDEELSPVGKPSSFLGLGNDRSLGRPP
jgi:hypothetical protein